MALTPTTALQAGALGLEIQTLTTLQNALQNAVNSGQPCVAMNMTLQLNNGQNYTVDITGEVPAADTATLFNALIAAINTVIASCTETLSNM